MSKIVILGAGIASYTAALISEENWKEHEVLVVSPNSNYQWVPSISGWAGRMKPKEVIFPLAPLYKKKKGIEA